MESENPELWKRYRDGDRQAYEELVETYLPIVKITVGRMMMHAPSFISQEELYSAGCMGLLSALERYDPSREAKFTTYAITRIRGSILDELRSHDVLGRVTRDRCTKISRAEAEIRNSDGDLSPENIAEKAGLTISEYWDAELGSIASRRISLSELAEDGEHSLADLMPQKRNPKPDHEMEISEVIDVVTDLLTEKEKLLVVLYYKEELTLKEIGQIMEVSESRVCQIHAEMAKRIRKKLEKNGILF